MFGGAWLNVWRLHAQRRHIELVGLAEALRDHLDVHPLVGCGLVDFVVHISDVAGVDHLWIMAAQHLAQQIKNHRWASVADVGVVIDRGPAGI